MRGADGRRRGVWRRAGTGDVFFYYLTEKAGCRRAEELKKNVRSFRDAAASRNTYPLVSDENEC